MRVELSKVIKLRLTQLSHPSPFRLDPVTVILEDYESGRGKILIECCGESWTSYWGNMGGRDISRFFCTNDEHYLASCLSSIPGDIPDYTSLSERARKEVIGRRRGNQLTADKARELFDECKSITVEEALVNHDVLQRILGDEWFRDIPSKPNPEYSYLCRIIAAVKEGLQQSGLYLPKPDQTACAG